MTLILGAHLTRKLYLVSDTRLTFPDGTISDNFIKAVVLNKRIAAVAAGHVSLASYTLREMKKRLRKNSSASYLGHIVEHSLEGIVRDYVNTTGRVNESASFIFAGFNTNRTKMVNSGRLGEVMSAALRSRGEGAVGEQSIDPAITQALGRAIEKHNGYLPPTDIEIPGVQQTEMTTLQIAIGTNELRISPLEPVSPYDYAIFHPQANIETVQMPAELLSELDFRAREGGLESVAQDSVMLSGFVLKTALERGFQSVGGNIFALLVTPDGAIFPTGGTLRVENGRTSVSKMYVKDGELWYQSPDGSIGRYNHLESAGVAEASGAMLLGVSGILFPKRSELL